MGSFFMSLRLVDVCKSFKVGNEVSFNLKKVNISFGDKGFYAITGQSGCGKTTLLNLITGIEKCDGGKIYYFEKEIKNFESFRMQNIGMIFQSYNVLKDYSGLFNYQIPLFEDNKIDKSKIYEKHNLSKDTIKKECKYLSGGEKQRISLCRAIVKKPSIIICDEPTGSLDEDNSVIVMQELKKLSKNKLVIMVSHNDKLVKRYADTIFHFENGKIIEEINKTRGENENNVSKIQYEKKESFFECIIALKRIKNNFGRFILLSIVMTISMFVATFACTISNNFVTYSENEKKNFADYNVVSICKIQKRKIENSLLSFSKTTRPTLNDMQGITSLAPNSEIYVDLNGLLRPNFYFLNGDKIGQEVRFVPLFNIDKYSINQVAVNNIF